MRCAKGRRRSFRSFTGKATAVTDIYTAENYGEMSRAAADEIVGALKGNPKAVLVLATGHSPRLAYRIAAERIREEGIVLSDTVFVKLDEWLGLSGDDAATCEYFLKNEFLEPLGVGKSQYLHFDPEASDPDAECLRVKKAFEKLPAPDLVILGVGRNGHLGLNEPAPELRMSAHRVKLDPATLEHEMLTHAGSPVFEGVTLGIGDLFSGKRILLLVDGEGKKAGYEALLSDRIDTHVPVSLLKLHPHLRILVNRESLI